MKKCLIVDDVEVTRFTSEQIVKSLGLNTVAVLNGDDALEILSNESIDIVLLDWHLRKLSGLDVLKKIRAEYGNKIKVVVFSGVEGTEKQAEAISAGADAFLAKPTTKEKISDCLKSLHMI